jgi:biopolymer transport protein ExbD
MGMSVGDKDDGVMAEINTTPLVDVMLVLLIIFLITVPVAIQAVPVNLPQVTNIPTTTKPENVSLSVDTDCDVYWGLSRMESNESLRERGVTYLLAEVERQKAVGAAIELPEVHIRGDGAAQWQCVGGPISAMQRAGYQKIGFISNPDRTIITR